MKVKDKNTVEYVSLKFFLYVWKYFIKGKKCKKYFMFEVNRFFIFYRHLYYFDFDFVNFPF